MTEQAEHPESFHQTSENPVSQTKSTDNVQVGEGPMKRLIGSQRNPDAYRPKPSIPLTGTLQETLPEQCSVTEATAGVNSSAPTVTPETKQEPETLRQPKTVSFPPETPEEKAAIGVSMQEPEDVLEDGEVPDHLSVDGEKALRDVSVRQTQRIQVPKFRRGKMSDDLEEEFNAVFADQSLDNLLNKTVALADQESLEPDTKVKAKVLAVQGDSVFLDIGAREQGLVSLKMFPPDAEPKIGDVIDVTVLRLEDGLYEVSVPLAAADVRDWSQVQEGMVVEAKITKTNNGGLECEVNRLRGFIPISQIDLFRVEDTEQYVGQKFNCIVEEVNPERRNLVLSRRALLNRERDEKKAQLLDELAVGQIREGLIRKIIDAGAFVDLGGLDGFIPISKISWGRINHPSDILAEGTRVKVRIDRIEEGTNRISLVYRDDASNPWSNINERFQERAAARGKVTRTTDFGAFVELMPGVEGLIHISELSHKRVNNVREAVRDGDWVDVYIISIDPQTKRIALSIKQLAPAPEPENKTSVAATEKDIKPEVLPPPVKSNRSPKASLKGGTGKDDASGNPFGLNW